MSLGMHLLQGAATPSSFMQIGINLPWIACGHDFGPRPPPWRGRGDTDSGPPPIRNWKSLGEQFAQWRQTLGIEVVRLWVLAAGVNYPVGTSPLEVCSLAEMHPEDDYRGRGSRALRAMLVRSTWERSELLLTKGAPPPPLPKAFLDDFEALFAAAAEAGVRLMPSLCSFELFHPIARKGVGVVSRGRGAFVFGDEGDDVAQIERFYDATLEPLLDIAGRHRQALEAFEVINEPDWAVENGPMHGKFRGWKVRVTPKTVSAAMMSRFLERGVQRILDRDLKATIGFKLARPRWVDDGLYAQLARWGSAGKYLHQIHHYPSLYEPWPLPRHERLPIRPCIVGEMPTKQARLIGLRHGYWWERPRDIARAASEQEYLIRRLEIVEERGYPMALLWSANATDGMTDWSSTVQAQLRGRHARQGSTPR